MIFAGAVRTVDETDAPGKRREKTRCGKREDKGTAGAAQKPSAYRPGLPRQPHRSERVAPPRGARPDSNGWQERRRPRHPALGTRTSTLRREVLDATTSRRSDGPLPEKTQTR
jgi:hypothetical protein